MYNNNLPPLSQTAEPYVPLMPMSYPLLQEGLPGIPTNCTTNATYSNLYPPFAIHDRYIQRQYNRHLNIVNTVERK